MNRFYITAISLVLPLTAAAQTEVPHTFQAGQPARAAEVNANFSAVVEGIQALENATSGIGGLKVYAQGVELGTFLTGAGFALLDSKAFVVSDRGYVFMIGLDNDEYLDKGNVYFAGPGCTGDAILSIYEPSVATWVKFFGYVGDYGDGNLYYMPRPVSFVELQVMSGIYLVDYDSGTWSCVTSSETSTASGFLVLPNDETITGVSSTPFPGPYTIGVPD